VTKSITTAGAGVGATVVDVEVSSENSLATTKDRTYESTSKTGFLGAGGNINITTSGDAKFVGTAFSAEKDINIDSGGDVSFESAKDISSYTSLSTDTSVSVQVSADFGSVSATNKRF
jgi:hypothetical protein